MSKYITKPFDKKSYDDNDPRAREAVTKYLIKKGYSILGIPNNDNRSADLLSGKKDTINNVMTYQWHEFSIACKWKESFPNKEFILMRASKRHYVEQAKADPRKPKVFFWSIKNDETEAYVFTGESLLAAPVVLNKFWNSPPGGEHSCHVPLSCAKLIKL